MIIIEIQYSREGAPSVLYVVKETKETAEQEFHTKLAYAAVSSVPVHSVVMLNEVGERVDGKTYYHDAK